jgi:hypothetical protein
MITKTKLKLHIDQLPENISIDDLIDQLILIEKIEIGNEQSQEGHVISDEELDKEIESWFTV